MAEFETRDANETRTVEFETIEAKETKFGKNNFLEIARKKAKTETGENEFIAISRGFFTPTGERRYKKSVALPVDGEVIDFVISALSGLK